VHGSPPHNLVIKTLDWLLEMLKSRVRLVESSSSMPLC
jgi:hypothetical protein